MGRIIRKCKEFKGEVIVGADKSISHRAVIFSALAKGESVVENFLLADDTIATSNCIRQLGIEIVADHDKLRIKGKGLKGLSEPSSILYCGNSGTTMRLLTGLLSGQDFFSVLSGDNSLNQRPMQRIIKPLSEMGGEIHARANGNYAPFAVIGKPLRGFTYNSPIASAQIKSALLLAGLTANEPTTIVEPQKSRNHSENMLKAMGADIIENGLAVTISPGRELIPQTIKVPNDISSAVFFIVAASIIPGAEVLVKSVGINQTRAGVLEVLEQMGANIKKENESLVNGELVADLVIRGALLNSIEIQGEIIPRLIDEIPILAVAMAVADGRSVVRDASELRVKETDRIKAICSELGKMGVDITEIEDGFIIEGNYDNLKGVVVDSWGDHRIAMSLAVAGLLATGATKINNAQVVDISFPEFWERINDLNFT
ncbi:MAG TPA: 3-phosphoshikimate 1-carboxyvinyltransferase [Syntrophomonadaceae bacterium]|nr:3-phosphoshikimate 1-carboxyvinyltransferase [Syntrophomonadaceae bacterium]